MQCLCRIYAFLRDSHENSWRVPKLEAAKLTALTQTVASGHGAAALLAGVVSCRKCRTGVHGDGPCPFSSMTDPNARKAARKLLREMAANLEE